MIDQKGHGKMHELISLCDIALLAATEFMKNPLSNCDKADAEDKIARARDAIADWKNAQRDTETVSEPGIEPAVLELQRRGVGVSLPDAGNRLKYLCYIDSVGLFDGISVGNLNYPPGSGFTNGINNRLHEFLKGHGMACRWVTDPPDLIGVYFVESETDAKESEGEDESVPREN